ncbi:hypothetical protein EV193_10980 [Herbihabitans rhizosphaerae]|uniref:Uncharacterized protein n=1 Tax=Herbihabitans rhizosphaerae TaxID=1872711 RepID=A0A4Q7KGB5_9PSEU|nr:hypothetical protein [Herbihabitans rhizosphaerae]RZS34293.1 hypothetical protein EV193_10980 [Herbihabitans rhizosphaerae]
MVTHERLVEWLRTEYGWRHLDKRVHDLGYAYSVDTQPDAYHDGDENAMTWGNGPLLVIKSSGKVYEFGSNPMFQPIWTASTEQEFDAAVKATRVRVRPTKRIKGRGRATAPPPAPDPFALQRDSLIGWLRTTRGWRHLDDRIRDIGYAYWVDTQPDEYLDGRLGPQWAGGALLVLKRTGEVYDFGANSLFGAVYQARSEQEFQAALAATGARRTPHEQVPPDHPPPEVTRELLTDWMTRRHGWRHLDSRITDAGYAFVVGTQPDAYHDGDASAMTVGSGPFSVLKRTGEVFGFGSNPIFQPVWSARSEDEFRAALAGIGVSAEPVERLPVGAPEVGHAQGLTREKLIDWMWRRRGWLHVDRITDLGYAFAVEQQPDAYYAGDRSAYDHSSSPLIVVKGTGAVWGTVNHPAYQDVWAARSDDELRAALARLDVHHPEDEVPSGPPGVPMVTRDQVNEFARLYGWEQLDRRIGDLGYAFSIDTQSDGYYLGTESMTYGNGPLIVLKRTGNVYRFSSNPVDLEVYTAPTEKEFLAGLRRTRRDTEPETVIPPTG